MAVLHDRATLELLDHKPLLRIGAVDVTSGDLRAYATLLWVGKAAIIGYVTVSITQRGGPGGVRFDGNELERGGQLLSIWHGHTGYYNPYIVPHLVCWAGKWVIRF